MMYRMPNRKVEVLYLLLMSTSTSPLSFPTRLMMGRNSETSSFPRKQTKFDSDVSFLFCIRPPSCCLLMTWTTNLCPSPQLRRNSHNLLNLGRFISLDLDLQTTSQSETRGRPGIPDVEPQHESCHSDMPVTGPPGFVGHLHRQRGHLPQ